MKKIAIMALIVLQATALAACNINSNGGGKAAKATAVSTEERQQVDAAAQRILATLDSGQYGSAWDGGAPILKKAATREAFEKQLQSARGLVKDWRTRAMAETTFHDTLPDGTPGRIAAIYNEVECGKASCEEQVVLQNVDGSWLLAGYHVEKKVSISL